MQHDVTTVGQSDVAVPQGPLADLRILDMTIAMAGPLATSRLGDLGADVIKVESPQGDFSREWPLNGYRHGADSSAFMMLNRNKRAMVIDLKKPEARALFYDMVRKADALVQNFRPGVAERLGIGYETLHEINPALVYVSISGYGDTGPMVAQPGQDLLVQCFSGLAFNAGTRSGLPHPSPVYMVDACASHLATQAVMAGYIARLRTGQGQHFKTSLLAAALEIQVQEISTYLTSGRMAERSEHPFASNWMEAPYGVYRTADDFIAIAHVHLPVLAEAFGDEDFKAAIETEPDFEHADARLAFRDRIGALTAKNFARKTTEEWLAELLPQGIWVGPVLTYADLANHPQTQDFFTSVEHPAGPYRTLAPAITYDDQAPVRRGPRFAEHTDEILREFGLDSEAIAALHQAGVVQ